MSASHHGPADQKPMDEALLRRFMDQLENRAKREYPQGRLEAQDEGALAIALHLDRQRKVLTMDFGKQLKWIGLGPCELRHLINKFKDALADMGEPLVINIGK